MMNQPPDFPKFVDLLDLGSLTDAGIELSNQQIDRAVQLSQPIPHLTQQWQTDLYGLALVGFEQSLEEWASDLKVDESSCSIFQPAHVNLIDTICHLQIGRFDLCLIAIPLERGSTIDLPKAIIDLPQFVPDVYVLVEVQEEQMQVQLYGHLRRDQMIAYRQSRLYAFAWMLSSSIDTVQWTLLIILGTQRQTHLPSGIRLQVRDQAQLLCEQVSTEATHDSYLYAQVGSDISDRFWVTIDLPNRDTISLPSFIFYPDAELEEVKQTVDE